MSILREQSHGLKIRQCLCEWVVVVVVIITDLELCHGGVMTGNLACHFARPPKVQTSIQLVLNLCKVQFCCTAKLALLCHLVSKGMCRIYTMQSFHIKILREGERKSKIRSHFMFQKAGVV